MATNSAISFTSTLLNIIGLFTTVSVFTKVFSLLRSYLHSSKLSRYAHLSLNGESPWAMVTGASDGIGCALVQELAGHGFNVTVVELQRSFPERSFKVIVADANNVACVNCLKTHRQGSSNDAPLDFATIKNALDGLHLTVLMNNVGGNPVPPIFVPLRDKTEVKLSENVSLNALFPLHLTRTLLPNLLQNAPSLLINVSTMADQGLPLLASYSASKQFLLTLTSTLRLEMMLEGTIGDIEILGVRTGRVTGVAGYKESPSLFVPDTKTFARAVLAHAGHGSGIVVGYWAHMIQHFMGSLMPPWVADRVMVSIMRSNAEWELKTNKEA
ncbi:NAD(P)-binding protein [Hypoxylon crocopeplum]|nr:NAD(P)-binding protein [Hypoxylon crocopeplum]